MHKILFSLLLLALLSACSQTSTPVRDKAETAQKSACYVIYDAGSSGTRLYIYQQQGEEWLEHAGPKVSALADPVREIRGKRWQDAEAVTDEVVAALDNIQQAGQKWTAFDWPQQCELKSAQVFATAGMRIAEQENRSHSAALWAMLDAKLQQKLGADVAVQTRTLSGFEEGLFAWLTVGEQRAEHDFGIVEMGGASSQVTFACPDCSANDDAVRTIMLKQQPIQIYSYSFLGLGQDEAPKTLGMPAACAYGIGLKQTNWQPSDCSSQIQVQNPQGIFDPYNVAAQQRGIYEQMPAQQSQVTTWFLTGAFNYNSPEKVQSCCMTQGQCFNAENACFQTLYLDKYLAALKVPANAEKRDVSWTRGALICNENDCLAQAPKPLCRWSAEGCL